MLWLYHHITTDNYLKNGKNSKNNKFNKILELEREKAKKGNEKSSNFTKIGKIKKKFHCYPKRLSNKYTFVAKNLRPSVSIVTDDFLFAKHTLFWWVGSILLVFKVNGPLRYTHFENFGNCCW